MKKIFLILLLLPLLFFAKSYSITSANVIAEIQSDGSVSMSEEMTFDFDGDFTYAYRDFELQGEQISNVQIYEDGQPLRFEQIGNRVKWFYSASDEKRTFQLKYRLTNAVDSYNDVNEFYWKLWPGNFPYGSMDFTGKVILPKSVDKKESIARWAYPKLKGTLKTENDLKTVATQAVASPSQWIEIRVVFPKEILSSFSGANVINSPGLNKILDQNKNWQKPDQDESLNFVGILSIFLTILFPFFYLGYTIYLWYKYGREPEINYKRDYEQFPPYDYSPSIVGALMNPAEPKPMMKDFVATILYLTTKGYLKIEKIKTGKKKFLFFGDEIEDYKITFLKKPVKEAIQDQRVYEILERASNKDSITFGEFEKKALYNRMAYRGLFEEWKNKTEEDINAMNFFTDNSQIKYPGYILIGLFALSFLSFLFGLVSSPFLIDVAIGLQIFSWVNTFICAIIYMLMRVALRAKTKEGALHYKRWKALEKYIRDFSNFEEKPLTDIILWEKYFVYATSLGIADKVIEQMKKINFSEKELQRSNLITSSSMFTSMAFANSINNFSAKVSSAGGYSGGFSGGGGAGGGGGGGGAG